MHEMQTPVVTSSPAHKHAAGPETRRFKRAFWLTGLAVLLERFGAPLMRASLAPVLFIILSWFGVFAALPPLWRMALGLLLVAGLIASLWRDRALRLPRRAEILARLDQTRPDLHRPLATLADKPATMGDGFAQALWAAHQARAKQAAEALDAPQGDARLRFSDPYALRALAVLLLVSGAFIAAEERGARLMAAFGWSSPRIPPVPPRLDAWIDPPAYTGRPPLFLTGSPPAPGEVLRVPYGASLTIRLGKNTGDGAPDEAVLAIKQDGGLEEMKEAEAAPKADGFISLRRIITRDATFSILYQGREMGRYSLAVIPDLAPRASLNTVVVEPASPDRQSPAGIRLGYALEDDYGIAKAEMVMERAEKAGRVLIPPPNAAIPLRLGAGELVLPTEDHPWAGERVEVKLRAGDDLGQSGESAAKPVTLPRRPFTNPLAKALVEQRRALVFAPDDKQRVVLAFDALMFAPERFLPDMGDYLALATLRAGLVSAKTDAALVEMVERIYDLALKIETGDMSDAERRLKEAEARLNDALERNAPPEEIRKLAEEMRRAMDQYLRELAEKTLRDPDQAENRMNAPERMLSQRDLNEMLRKIEEMARKGDKAEAQRLLNELKQMLDQLRSAQRQQADPRMQELGRQIEELERLQREQRALRDETFRQGQQNQPGQRQQGQQKGQPNQPQPGAESLQRQQQALQERLKQLREALKQKGLEEGEGFGEAQQGMGEAEGELGQGRPDSATDGQQQALDGLGRAAEGMAQQLQQQMGEGENPGSGQPGPSQNGRSESRSDPLGRSSANKNRAAEDESKLTPLDLPNAGVGERAERVLRELRRRLGEFERPREELDYLERLLKQK